MNPESCPADPHGEEENAAGMSQVTLAAVILGLTAHYP